MTAQKPSLGPRDLHGKPSLELEADPLYRFGHLIRLTEQKLLQLFSRGLLSGTTHTCIGQELCQMSVVRALDHENDAVFSNHRNHGHFLTYSGDFAGLLAEVMGRQGGVCNGRGGSQHLAWRNFHSNGVQAGMTAIGAGAALARKRSRDGSIVCVFVGDGTTGEGLFYEALNLSSIWNLPILFVVENNGIAQTTPTACTIGGDLAARGQAFGVRTWRLTDSSIDFFHQTAAVVRHVRESARPGLLVIDTQRLGPHSKGDDSRSEEELQALVQQDPLRKLRAMLDGDRAREIEAANSQFISEASAWAEASAPARDPVQRRSIFAGDSPWLPPQDAPESRNFRGALNSSLRRLLAGNENVLLLGEDMHDPYGGAFKVTAGLSSEWPERVLSTPISEAALVGCGIGLAMNGYRPIVEVMFADFLTLAIDQLYNHAVKFPALCPELTVPLVVRTPSGGRRGYGPTHSQSTENLACAVPGLTVVFPSQRHQPGLLLEAAVDWPYPTLFFEHKLLYGAPLDGGEYEALKASPRDIAAGRFPALFTPCATRPDLTILTYGGMVEEVEAVARQLRTEEELSVEVVILALLSPLPKNTLADHLADCPRLAVVEEAHCEFGIGAEIVASLAERGFQGRMLRIATPPVPIPSARSLESFVIPDKEEIRSHILTLFE